MRLSWLASGQECCHAVGFYLSGTLYLLLTSVSTIIVALSTHGGPHAPTQVGQKNVRPIGVQDDVLVVLSPISARTQKAMHSSFPLTPFRRSSICS